MRNIILLCALSFAIAIAQDGITSRIRALQTGVAKAKPKVELRTEKTLGRTTHLGVRMDSSGQVGAVQKFAEQYFLKLTLFGDSYGRYLAADGVELWAKGKKLDSLNRMPIKTVLAEVISAPMTLRPGPERWILRWAGVKGIELRFPMQRELLLGMDKVEQESIFAQTVQGQDSSLVGQWVSQMYQALASADSLGRSLTIPALSSDSLHKCADSAKSMELRHHFYGGATNKLVVPCKSFWSRMDQIARMHVGFEEPGKDSLHVVVMLVDRWFNDSHLLYGTVPKDSPTKGQPVLSWEIFTFIPDSKVANENVITVIGGKTSKFRISQ
jgi:hypothetical protein